MLMHAKDDEEIPPFHSLAIFDKLMQPVLPPAPPAFADLSYTVSESEFNAVREQHTEYKRVRDELVHKTRTKEDGFVKYELERDIGAKTVFNETLWGGHDRMALQEGVLDMIKEMFALVVPGGC